MRIWLQLWRAQLSLKILCTWKWKTQLIKRPVSFSSLPPAAPPHFKHMLHCYFLLNSDLGREKQACSMCFELQSNQPLLQKKRRWQEEESSLWKCLALGKNHFCLREHGMLSHREFAGSTELGIEWHPGEGVCKRSPLKYHNHLPQNIHLYTSQILFRAHKIMVKCSTLVIWECYVMPMYSKKAPRF